METFARGHMSGLGIPLDGFHLLTGASTSVNEMF